MNRSNETKNRPVCAHVTPSKSQTYSGKRDLAPRVHRPIALAVAIAPSADNLQRGSEEQTSVRANPYRHPEMKLILCLFLALVGPRIGVEAEPPANDDFSKAELLVGTEIHLAGSLAEATTEAEEGINFMVTGFAAKSVWFKWVAPVDGAVQLAPGNYVGHGGGGTFARLLEGDSIEKLSLAPEIPGSSWSTNVFRVSAGHTYHIQLGFDPGIMTLEPDFTLSLKFHRPPGNDLFANRLELSGSEVNVTNLLILATQEAGDPIQRVNQSSAVNTLWFSWIAPDDGYLRAWAFAHDWDTRMGFYSGDDLAHLSAVTNRDFLGASISFSSPVGFLAKVNGGARYELLLAASIADAGDFTIVLRPAAVVALSLKFLKQADAAPSLRLGNNWLRAEGPPEASGYRVKILRSHDLTNWDLHGISEGWISGWTGAFFPLGGERETPAEFFKGELVW